MRTRFKPKSALALLFGIIMDSCFLLLMAFAVFPMGENNISACHCTCNCNTQPQTKCVNSTSQISHDNSLRKPSDCQDVYKMGFTNTGGYVVYPKGIPSGIYVRCDMDTAGGGWTVIQRRVSGNVDFFRDWIDYKKGFGEPYGSLWLGNDNIHALTGQANYQLRIDMSISKTKTVFAYYNNFSVGDENSGYLLTVSGYSGTAGDSLTYHSGMKLSTKDKDNDLDLLNCAELWKGCWWYTDCVFRSNLNGVYGYIDRGVAGILWFTYTDLYTSLAYADMKIRRKDGDS